MVRVKHRRADVRLESFAKEITRDCVVAQWEITMSIVHRFTFDRTNRKNRKHIALIVITYAITRLINLRYIGLPEISKVERTDYNGQRVPSFSLTSRNRRNKLNSARRYYVEDKIT